MEDQDRWEVDNPQSQEGKVAAAIAEIILEKIIEQAAPGDARIYFLNVLPGRIGEERVLRVETSSWIEELDLESKLNALGDNWIDEYDLGEDSPIRQNCGGWKVFFVYRTELGVGFQFRRIVAAETLKADLRRLREEADPGDQNEGGEDEPRSLPFQPRF